MRMSEEDRHPPVPLPEGLSQPAQRALANAGIANLADVTKHTDKNLAALHGVGPKTIRQLRAALAEQGWSFAPV
jgi:hypothetical protein